MRRGQAREGDKVGMLDRSIEKFWLKQVGLYLLPSKLIKKSALSAILADHRHWGSVQEQLVDLMIRKNKLWRYI